MKNGGVYVNKVMKNPDSTQRGEFFE